MSLQARRWQLKPPVDERQLARLPDLPPLVVQLLHNRGIEEPGDAHAFLGGRFAGDDPFQLKGMDRAVARLRQAIRAGERIAVYGDFDADGITATALLVQALQASGARVEPYIPNRVDEGYGLNLGALRKLYRQGVRVVVTVDCGIRSVKEIRQAGRHLAMIVTDHHTPRPPLPPAVAIVNPKQPGCPYPFKDLAGVGLAYKLAQALFRVGRKMGSPPAMAEDLLLDLVALGTVADLAPLRGENRALVRRGLELLNRAERPGIEALMAEASVRRGEVDAETIGFRLGPRLNAAGRIADAMPAYHLLTITDPLETQHLARQLGQLNKERQNLTERTVTAAEAQILAAGPDAQLYMAADPQFKAGIVGLAASRLTDAYYRPSIVVQQGEEVSRGSCRSIPEFNIIEALDRCDSLLLRHGGHAAAAGFTIATERLAALRDRLQAMASEELAGKDLRPLLTIDAELPLEEIDWATHHLLAGLEPYGMDNPVPVFLSRDVAVRERRVVGSGEHKHLKLSLRDGRGVSWDAMYFRAGHLWDQVPARVDVAYTLGVHEWNHERNLQLVVQDLAAPDPQIGGL